MDSEAVDVDRVQMEEQVRSVKHKNSRNITVEMTAVDHGTPGRPGQVQLLINSGFYKILLSK